MSTRHVLLGLLDIKPMSGYDVQRNLGISLESLWAASYGQIYPTLHALAAEGLIRAEDVPSGKRERIVYHLLPEGRQVLRDWLEQPVKYLPYRDPFKFWASYIDVLPDEVVLAGIDRHAELNRERLAYFAQVIGSIESGEHPMIRARAEQLEPAALERLKATRAMIFRELAEQARFELDSAERIRQFWRELQQD
jgi:DNA-binding PadR family transcriptional regulator